MGPPMKTLTQIIRHPYHRLELMRVEWNVIKSAVWLEIGIHTPARMFVVTPYAGILSLVKCLLAIFGVVVITSHRWR